MLAIFSTINALLSLFVLLVTIYFFYKVAMVAKVCRGKSKNNGAACWWNGMINSNGDKSS
jgi:hypothetical protein